MAASILLAQAGQPAGSAGKARLDFETGVSVSATVQGGPFLAQQWSFVARPYNEDLSARSNAAFTAPSSSSTGITPIDVPGEYLIQVVVDSGQGLGATEDDRATVLFYAGAVGNPIKGPINTDPGELPQRMPAFRETLEDNFPTLVEALGNSLGWAYAWLRLKAVLERIWRGKSWAWARVAADGTPDGTFNADVLRTDVGKYTVTFTRSLANDTYAVLTGVETIAGGVTILAKTPLGFDVERGDVGGTLVDQPWSFDVRCSP